MNRISILDCTLRDGGYCNHWAFGYDNIIKIVDGLVEANIDIIECGFLTNRIDYHLDISKFTSIEQIAFILPKEKKEKIFVCLLNYGEYNLDDIPPYDSSSIDGIRVAFHKKDMYNAMQFCKGIVCKGYKVFLQPMVSLNYSDEEFIELIDFANAINPFAFYIVDSFGAMKKRDLVRLFYIVEHRLHDDIIIGYHSHNNMQLAYSNALALTDIRTNKELIIDASIFGMGRGAGNLNTELFVEYLNESVKSNYRLKPLLSIIDQILNKFYQENYWGYSLPNYLSAAHNLHPNYASYLVNKETLTVEDIDKIFTIMDPKKKAYYDKEYIESLYITYLNHSIYPNDNINEFKNTLRNREILLIAPGKSGYEEKEKILKFVQENNVITISINFDYPLLNSDYIFLSNLRRYKELDKDKLEKCIATSNIDENNVYIKLDYYSLLNDEENVRDNAALMLIKFLIESCVKKIYLAGMDGYSYNSDKNYIDSKMNYGIQNKYIDIKNDKLSKILKIFASEIEIIFLTSEHYLHLGKK